MNKIIWGISSDYSIPVYRVQLSQLIITYFSGELREEIQVQSNAILTIERRADRRADLVQQRNLNAEVCVSKIGFIIALVITALLALVAVAIAVSCWLMAYKRRPKTTGPLPHPPEFPNPLFTTPEPLAEPTPDYLHWPQSEQTNKHLNEIWENKKTIRISRPPENLIKICDISYVRFQSNEKTQFQDPWKRVCCL